MAAVVALCSGLGKRKLTCFTTAIVCLTNPGIHAGLWRRSCSQYKQFISPFIGCICRRHITGLCGNKKKEITEAINRAQIWGFMPVTYKDPPYLKDPKVCNIKYRK
ncbi:hypothetical protein K5549_015591 [Capra hircus]|nr:hypothetical protein K5549_015591 [Capra hircus]